MAIMGLRGTGDWGTDERPKNFRETILWLNPNGSAPLTAVLSKARSNDTNDPEFSWWTEKLQAIRVKLSVAATNTTASVTLSINTVISDANGNTADATDLVAGDVLMAEPTATTPFSTTEYLVVAADPSSAGTVIVTRAALGSTVSTIPVGTILMKASTIFSEGSGAPKSATRNPVKDFNYTQIFKTTYDITRTANQTRARTGNARANDKKRKMFDHSVSLEHGMLFGRRSELTGSNGKPVRSTQGLVTGLVNSGRSTVFKSAVTEATFLAAIQDLFDFSTGSGAGDERMVLGGNRFMMSLNQLVKAQGQIQFGDTVKFYGMNLTRYVTPLGNLYFKRHPLFNQSTLLSSSAIVLDPSAIRYRYLQDTVAKDNIQLPDEDLVKGQWLTECGLELTTSVTSKFLQNVTYP